MIEKPGKDRKFSQNDRPINHLPTISKVLRRLKPATHYSLMRRFDALMYESLHNADDAKRQMRRFRGMTVFERTVKVNDACVGRIGKSLVVG